ncbi:MAG: hypothetical protein ACE5EH_03990 [Gammaproteobacteria bacterium]
MLSRLKWFLLSIIVIFSWFTPGQSLFTVDSDFVQALLPTYDGIFAGLLRISALAIIVFAVNLLLREMPRQQLLMALRSIASPLEYVGISRDTVTVRLSLTLDAFEEVRFVVSSARSELKIKSFTLQSISDLTAAIYDQVRVRAENPSSHEVIISVEPSPPIYQWLLPVLMAAFFWIN